MGNWIGHAHDLADAVERLLAEGTSDPQPPSRAEAVVAAVQDVVDRGLLCDCEIDDEGCIAASTGSDNDDWCAPCAIRAALAAGDAPKGKP